MMVWSSLLPDTVHVPAGFVINVRHLESEEDKEGHHKTEQTHSL